MTAIPWTGLYADANPQTQSHVDDLIGPYMRSDGVRFIHLTELRDLVAAAIVGGVSIGLESEERVVTASNVVPIGTAVNFGESVGSLTPPEAA